MSFFTFFMAQFRHPTGPLGSLVGIIMSYRKSNVERSKWAIGLLNIQPTDRVLETGYGPGVAIRKISAIVTQGVVVGIDYSEVMYAQASRRNRQAIEAGRVRLLLGEAAELPPDAGVFDKWLDANSFQFWDDKVETLRKLRSRMSAGGVIALAHQPRQPGATEADTTAVGEKFAGYLKEAGFQDIRIERMQMRPVSVVCVMGKN